MTTAHTSFSNNDWNRYAECYDVLLELGPYQDLLSEVVAALCTTTPGVLLDAGCGTGNLLKQLHDQCDAVQLWGIDASPNMLSYAQHKCAGEERITFLSANLDHVLPFPDRMFESVSSVNVLYAVPNPQQTLTELHRVLVPRGRLVLVTPKQGYDNGFILKAHARSTKPESYWANAHATPEREESLLREALGNESLVEKMLLVAEYNRHIARNAQFHFFTRDEISSLVERSGFTSVVVTPTYAGQAHLIVVQKGER